MQDFEWDFYVISSWTCPYNVSQYYTTYKANMNEWNEILQYTYYNITIYSLTCYYIYHEVSSAEGKQVRSIFKTVGHNKRKCQCYIYIYYPFDLDLYKTYVKKILIGSDSKWPEFLLNKIPGLRKSVYYKL